MDRDNNAISSKMLGPTGLKKIKKKSWMWFGYNFADLCVYTMVDSPKGSVLL